MGVRGKLFASHSARLSIVFFFVCVCCLREEGYANIHIEKKRFLTSGANQYESCNQVEIHVANIKNAQFWQ